MHTSDADLRDTAARLLDALDTYDGFVDAWRGGHGSVPEAVETSLSERDVDDVDPDTSPAVALVDRVTELYYQARDGEARYVQRARAAGRRDWSAILAATEPVRGATRRVHTAGYGIDPETGEPGYLLPPDLCPAHRVSMNDGTSPITFEKRVAQYRAVADRFDLAPEVVYHPGAGHDVSPSAAFPQTSVVYVDVDEAAITDLDRAGYEAVGADASGYEPGQCADVIVFRNAGVFEEAIVAANLCPGGWVLANDHLASARHVSRLESLDLVGTVPDTWSGASPSVVTGRPFEDGSPLDLYVFRHEV